jgi:oligosaccharide 4-alpha-D-glucosyltransferase
MDIGVRGWWSDLGEPQEAPDDLWYERGSSRAFYNPFSLAWARLIHETIRREHPKLRTFNLLRSGYAGMQRYGAFPWTGDVGAHYSGLQAQIPLMLQASINGLAYMHSDAGGFMGDSQPNPELFARWLQFSAFTPVMRPHSNGNGHLPEPIFYADSIQAIVRDFANLRHELMPYNYTLAYENSMNGMPLARPLFFYDDSPLALFHANDEYLWGDNLLVAPILTEGSREREIYFPNDGDWINFWTDELHRGGERTYVKAPLHQMPLFARAGSFVPRSLPYQTMPTYNTETLLVHYFSDANVPESEFRMYNDNGSSPQALAQQAFETLQFYATHQNNQLTFRFDQSGSYEGMPESRELQFIVHRFKRLPEAVRYNGLILEQSSAADDFDDKKRGWRWDSQTNKLYIKIPLESGQKGEITMK